MKETGIATRIVAEVVLAGHLVLAAFYWWLSPKGFPIGHCRFWLNSVLPVVLVIVAIAALTAMLRGRPRLATFALWGLAAAWLATMVAARVLFPIAFERLWLAAALPVVVVALASVLLGTRNRPTVRHAVGPLLAGAAAGYFVVWAQVPAPPSTIPAGKGPAGKEPTGAGPIGAPEGDSSPADSPLVRIGEAGSLHAGSGELMVQAGNLQLRCSPLLTFDRVSPDGFWSILATPNQHVRTLESCLAGAGEWLCRYSDGSTLRLLAPTEASRLELDAATPLEADTYSHLNSYCVLTVSGHTRLAVAFSPDANQVIDVLPADYPTGRPARFAYLVASGKFHVAEATSGEKGPFRDLASGPLARGEPLEIVIYDAGRPTVAIELADWTSQLSTALSPTAGWGVPVGAIEFLRSGNSEASAVEIYITLAATSVGRGWECVGHRAGVYRNRVRFRSAAAD